MAVTALTPVQPVKFVRQASACRIAFHARSGTGARACPALLAGAINAEQTAAGMPAGGTMAPARQEIPVIRANASRHVLHVRPGTGLPAHPQHLAGTASAERTAAGMPAGGTMADVRRVKPAHQASARRIVLPVRPGTGARVNPRHLAGTASAEQTAAGMPAGRLVRQGRPAMRASVWIVLIAAAPLAGHLTAAAAHARQGPVPAEDSARPESASQHSHCRSLITPIARPARRYALNWIWEGLAASQLIAVQAAGSPIQDALRTVSVKAGIAALA